MMKSLKRTSKIQTKIKTVLTQMVSVGVVALIGLFLIEAPASGFSGSGAGTQADPYQITNATQLQEMADDLNAHYVLANDIDCSDTVNWNGGLGFEPIGYDFRGTFDGRNHTITGLYINRPSTTYVGLFGIVQYTTIKNVGLEDVDITGGGSVAALYGYSHYVTVSNCYSTGNVNGDSSVGGLVYSAFHGTVSNCYSTANVNGNLYVGGLASHGCDGKFINCYSTGDVSGNTCVGGLVGVASCPGDGEIRNCYSTGDVSGDSNVGGLVGSVGPYDTVSNSYSTGSVNGNSDVGGLVGRNIGTITNCYYNNHAGNPSVGIGSGTGDCTAIENNVSYFYYSSNPPMFSWDFVYVWGIYEGCSYPYLLWHPHIVDTTPPEIICPDGVTVEQVSYDGTVVPLEATATDICDPNPVITSDELAIYPLGVTIVTFTATDASGNSASCSMSVTVVDTTPPDVEITFPTAGLALQDVVTLTAVADDWSGVSDVYFYVREPDGGDGIPIGYEAAWNGTTELWEFDFDTTGLLDGYYVILAKAIDTQDNEGWSEVVPFSIRNWAVLELLPASKSNKAGRTMPVKFSLRIAESVDAMMPFVYNEELEIIIYDAEDPDTILQTSLYGDTSRDYRIDSMDELYITNFKTKKQPAEYVVEIWRLSKDFLVENFTFETVK